MNPDYITSFFVLGTILLLAIAIFIVILFISYRNKQYIHTIEKIKLEKDHENKMLIAKLDTQEKIMNSFSMELHDNISQLLYLAQTNLKVLGREKSLQNDKLMLLTTEILSTIAEDIRTLGRSLNGDLMKGKGLAGSLEDEIKRLSHRQQLEGIFILTGIPFSIPPDKELMIFRIVQEAIQNALKHSAASLLHISLQYSGDNLLLKIIDNGKGFDQNYLPEKGGMGMLSMHHRARLIDADIKINSEIGTGTTITLSLIRKEE